MGFIIPRSPYAYFGGGLPGVNPNHPALLGGGAALLHFSGVALPGGMFRRVDRAETGTYTAGVLGRMNGFLGATVYANGTSDQIVYTNVSSLSPAAWTFAAILLQPSNVANMIPISIGQSGATVCNGLFNTGSAWEGYNRGNAFTGGGVGVTGFCAPGDPVFVIASQSAAGGQFTGVVNLRTGRRVTASSTATNTLTGNANITVLNGYTGSGLAFGPAASGGGSLAAAAVINAYLTAPVFMQWARDPWSFWYPQTARQAIFEAVRSSLPLNYVDFAGNIGDISLYGKGPYGAGLYSRVAAFTPTFAGDIDLVGQAAFDGDLAPVVSFAGNLTFQVAVGGDLAPVVSFTGDLAFTWSLAGDVAPSVTFNGDLTLTVALVALEGSFAPNVVFGASSFISGPLWPDAAPCPPPLWTETEPCPPSLWTPVDCGQVDWEDSELCRG